MRQLISTTGGAFRGHGLSLLKKTTLRGLRTHAIPAGVPPFVPINLFRISKSRIITLYMTFKTQPNHAKHERMAYSDHCSLMRARSEERRVGQVRRDRYQQQ